MPYQNIQSIKASAQNAVTPLRSLPISRMANLTRVSSRAATWRQMSQAALALPPRARSRTTRTKARL